MTNPYQSIFFILLGVLFITACSKKINDPLVRSNPEKSTSSGNDRIDSTFSAERYYYDKYFEVMAAEALDNGFAVFKSINGEYYYGIVKASAQLASTGDTNVVKKMILFLDSLRITIDLDNPLNSSHVSLFELYKGLPHEKVFAIAIQYMSLYKLDNPTKLNPNSFYENPSLHIFNIFIPFMESTSQEKYSSLILNEMNKSKTEYEGNLGLWYLWDSIYPIIFSDWKSNLIRFEKKE